MTSYSTAQSLAIAALFVGPAFSQSALWSTAGAGNGARFGLCVSSLGDLNADGVGDVLVGAPNDDVAGSDSGAIFALSGLDGSVIWRVNGSSSGASLGFACAGVGDVDGDGIGDALGGARFGDQAGPNFGEAIVVSGATGLTIYTFFGENSNGRFGEAVGPAGDVNGDGRADLIVGARLDNTSGATTGKARVYSGIDGTLLHSIAGDNASDFFGRSVGTAGDIDGDLLDDFVVGAPGDDDAGNLSGAVRVFSGADGMELRRFDGDSSGDQLGGKVAIAGDVNQDGVMDLIAGMITSSFGGLDRGAARVYSGADGSTLYTFVGTSLAGEFGSAVSGAGDVNGDGWPDVFVGARLDESMGLQVGSISLFSGLDGALLYKAMGPADFSQFGDTGVITPDVNGDGFADVCVGAFGDSASGSVVMLSGLDTIGTSICGPAALNSSGASARVLAEGSVAAIDNDLTLTVTQLPVGQNGIFVTSTEQNLILNPGGSDGNLCIASFGIGRYAGDVLQASAAGSVSLGIELGSVPLPTGTQPVMAGETRYWQFWFRDGASSNFSDAIVIDFQ